MVLKDEMPSDAVRERASTITKTFQWRSVSADWMSVFKVN
jgi:hypothetical protein